MNRPVFLLLFLMMVVPLTRVQGGLKGSPAAIAELPAAIAESPAVMMGSPAVKAELPAQVTKSQAAPNNAGRSDGTVRVILEEAEQALLERYDPNYFRFTAEPGWIPGSLARVPEDAIISVVPTGGPERHTTFTVRYRDGNRQRDVDVQLRLAIETNVPVAAERISAGTRIQADHLVRQWVEVSRERGQLVADAGELEGMTLRRTLAMGEPVRRSDITTEYLVRAGDTVNVVFSGEGMQIVLSAVARQNGAANEDIRVYSEQTRKTYLATVRSSDQVEWKRTL